MNPDNPKDTCCYCHQPIYQALNYRENPKPWFHEVTLDKRCYGISARAAPLVERQQARLI